MSHNFSMAKQANKSRKYHTFKVEDNVLFSAQNLSLEDGEGTSKLNPRFYDPFLVPKMISDVAAKLELSAPMKEKGIPDSFHDSLLKHYTPDIFAKTKEKPYPVQFADGHEEYEVEKRLNHRKRRGKIQFLVNWTNYPEHENTWEDEHILENATESLNEY